MRRLSTGNRRLDAILDGGLPDGGLNLVVGVPGSGKTMLVQQCVFANATPETPAVYFSTVSEPFDKIVRFGQTLSFFDPARVGSSVIFEDLGPVVDRGGVQAVAETIESAIRRHRPGIVVIDSFRALRAYAGPEEFRGFLHGLAGRASAYPASHFWIGEYRGDDMATAPEFAVADAVLVLSSPEDGQRVRRELEVLKLRGSGYQSGRHAYRLSADGLEVFPRLADPTDLTDYQLNPDRLSSGIPALDAMLGEGYLPGTSILIAGPTGIGKTMMGLHFIFNGAAAGAPGLIASLQEDDLQLTRVAEGFGWTLDDPNVSLVHASPVDLYVDQWVYSVLDRAEQVGAKRILVDSIDDLAFAVPDPVRFREYLYSFSQRCARRGISLMMTAELTDLFEIGNFGPDRISHISDTVVLLQYVRDGERLGRALTLLKSRATRHQPQTRRFSITSDGILLDAPVSSTS